MGIIPRLVSELGRHWTRRLALLGEEMTIHQLPTGHFFQARADTMDEAVANLVNTICRKPRGALRSIKRAILEEKTGEKQRLKTSKTL